MSWRASLVAVRRLCLDERASPSQSAERPRARFGLPRSRGTREVCMSDVIFEPLTFRNLTVKNRIFRSNIAGRFDNYDGSGNQARINWEVKFARGGVGAIISSFVPVQIQGRIIPNYATIDHDSKIPFWRAVGRAVHEHDCRFILQLSHSGRQRDVGGIEYVARPELHRRQGSAARLRVQADDDGRDQDDRGRVRGRRPARPRGRPRRRRAARRQRLSDHAVPQFRRSTIARTTTAGRSRTARAS